MVNYSNPLSAGGEIVIVPLVQRLGVVGQPSDWAVSGGFQQVVDALLDYKSADPHNLYDFLGQRKPQRFHATVADRNIYERFETWLGSQPDTAPGFNTFASEFMLWPGLTASRPRGMNYYAVYIPAVANAQTLNITVRASFYLRWPLNTALAEMQTTIPVSRGTLPERPVVSGSYLSGMGFVA